MDPQYLLLVVAAVACPVAMGGAMWLMMRQMNSKQMPMNTPQTQSSAQRIAALQAQREMLDKEIREAEQVQSLQAQRDQLQRQLATAPKVARHHAQRTSSRERDDMRKAQA